MYYYILDPHKLSVEKFERMQIELQGLLAEFKIAGEMARVTTLRTIGELVETASQRGVKTLIACGTDDTFNLMLANLKGRDFTIGFVPFDDDSYLAKILGLNNLQTAVKTIAGRRIEKIDLATVGNNYFISYLEFGLTGQQIKNANWWNSIKMLSAQGTNLTIRIDNSYNIDINCLGGLVVNSRSTSSKSEKIANPTDGFLEVLILEKLKRSEILKYKKNIAEGTLEQVPSTTVIKCRRVDFLEPKGFNLTISGKVMAKFPATVQIIPSRLKMIVGKNRTF